MKKRLLSLKTGLLMLSMSALALTQSCKKDNGSAAEKLQAAAASKNGLTTMSTTSNADLIAYKNSVHKIFVGFLVGDGADPAASYNPANAPDSTDFLEFFAGNDATRSHWRAAQAKGTRIVVCHFLGDAYFDGSSKDPATPTSTATVATATSTYDHWSQVMYNQHIVADSLDGIDLDIESGTIDNKNVTSSSYPNLLKSVAKWFGPNSTSAVTLSMGKKPVFFYDTDGSLDNNSLTGTKSNYDYILFQSYTTGSHFWSGSGTQSFSPLVTAYGLDKLIFLVNGDSFKHADGTEDQSGGDAKATSDLYSYANWVKANNGTGVGAYRMSRDYNHTPPFIVSRNAIQLMNGTGGGTTTTGVTFYQNTNYSGTVTSLIPKGTYTLAQLQAYGFVDNWASSVKVPSGWTVIMYTNNNFGGTSWTRTANTPDFTTLSPNANDKVTSVKIQ
ncbi:Putative glycoside hydrolase Family 18, chitinase_18 [Mucilaginibacter sp. OK268]|uniref:glycoside hydrolase family 18 n=1 Tax=Mucilaginibacter sp. OK268 TaxID=1881048 RepID=UPI0008805B1A|nr:glycoside hydrolase family 18 [Mucilaginibacter sp. OK268]SDQ00342.1 Putative glycoside hydrolase Family 18, chitinase_18 [Mucilaginibacter sp. OK268]